MNLRSGEIVRSVQMKKGYLRESLRLTDGLTHATISQWETGKTTPSNEMAKIIAVLDLRFSEIQKLLDSERLHKKIARLEVRYNNTFDLIV